MTFELTPDEQDVVHHALLDYAEKCARTYQATKPTHKSFKNIGNAMAIAEKLVTKTEDGVDGDIDYVK